MARPDYQFYKPDDMQAAITMFELHIAKMRKAASQEDWPSCCACLRAISYECVNASKIAAALSAKKHTTGARMARATIGVQHG